MRLGRLLPAVAAGLLAWAPVLRAAPAPAPEPEPPEPTRCSLQVLEHRSGLELLRLALPSGQAPQLRLAFTHSVLGTPVQDAYTWRNGHWLLTEEQFEGEGYGLPHLAAEGETLQRWGAGWRLLLNRPVTPLVVRSLPALQMRLLLPDGRQWLLGALSAQAIELTTTHC